MGTLGHEILKFALYGLAFSKLLDLIEEFEDEF